MGKRLRLVGVAACLCAAGSAPAWSSGSIVGGQPASRSYEYAAALRVTFPDLGEGRCAGALVAARYVLTAAHCFMAHTGERPTRIRVALGNVNYDSAVYTDVAPDNFGVHPRYTGRPEDGYDVGVLRLPAPVPNEQLRLLRPADAPLWAAGTRATVIGWGMTDDGQPASARLLEAEVPIHDDDACAADLAAAGAPSGLFKESSMLCAGGRDGRDACNGDSGGPLLVGDGAGLALAGVVSFGVVSEDGESCAEGIPGVYTRLGANSLNNYVRSIVPQVEVEWSPAAPREGERVALRAVGSPGSGPPHDGYAWDLDADGAFDDALGPSAEATFPSGMNVVAVRASRGAEGESRRVGIHVGGASTVAFTSDAIRVVEGQTAWLELVKRGRGTGEASVRVTGGTATPGADMRAPSSPVVAFSGDGEQRRVPIETVDDRIRERPESFVADISDLTRELSPAAPSRVTVTIVDNESRARIAATARRVRVRRDGRFALPYRSTRGRAVVRVTDAGGRRTYARVSRRHAKAGRYQARMRLYTAARAAMRGRSALGLRVAMALFDDGGDKLASGTTRLTLRR